MTDPVDRDALLWQVGSAADDYRLACVVQEGARRRLKARIIAALKAGLPPGEVARRGGFSRTWVRSIAQEAGLPPAPRGGNPPGRRVRS
jgi:hypothetical protein